MAYDSDFARVEAQLVARIGAISPAPYSSTYMAAAWRESAVPLTPRMDGAAIQHLLYDVWVADAPNTGRNRGRDTLDLADGTVWIQANVLVQFIYQLSPITQKADKAKALGAAVDVVQAIMGAQTTAEADAFGEINLDLRNGLQPSLRGEWLFVAQTYTASFDLLVRPAA